jgi:hypothetical protein
MPKKEKPGLWANIRAKRRRIAAGSGERMRKPGSKGAPTAQNFKDAAGLIKGGLVGDQYKLDINKDGKISGADFKMMSRGGGSDTVMCKGNGIAQKHKVTKIS